MKITDNIYIVASGKWGFGMTHELDCNAYLVDGGDGCILIDAGVGLDTDRMDGVLASHGFSLSDIRAVMLTHYHGDHACGAARIREASGCDVYAPSPEAEAISTGDEEATSLALAKGSLYPADFSYPRCPGVIGLNEGDEVTVGDVTLSVRMVPGHSLCSMAIYGTVDGKKCLFTGDSVFVCGQVLIQSLKDVSIFPYAQAIKRLAELETDALFPGHGVFCLENGGSHVKTAADRFATGLIPPQLYYFA